MIGNRKTLAVSIEMPGGDNPLLLDLKQSAPIYRGVPLAAGQLALVAKGGTKPYAYSILATSSNDLPPGLSFDSLSGQGSGTATRAGHNTFIAEVQDGASNVFPHSFSIEVLAQLFWLGPPPPKGEVGVAYNYRFRVRNASGVELTSGFSNTGTLPAGLTLTSAGVLSGTPTVPFGISYFTVHATDGTDTLDVPVALEIVEAVSGYYLEDRDPPNGWGGSPGTWLPSIIRLQKWEAHLVITGGVAPYSVSISDIDPFPTGFAYISTTKMVTGLTGDAADSANAKLMSLIVTDALGATHAIQRAAFIIDSPNGRITPQRNGADVTGGDGFTKLDIAEGTGIAVTASNVGGVARFEVNAAISSTDEGTLEVGEDSSGGLTLTANRPRLVGIQDPSDPTTAGIAIVFPGDPDY